MHIDMNEYTETYIYTLTNTHTHTHTHIHARTHTHTHTGMGICFGHQMEHLKAAQAFEGAARAGGAGRPDRLSAVGQETQGPLSVSPRQPLVTSVCERQREKVGGVRL